MLSVNLETIDFLCLLGAKAANWSWAGPWLDASLRRRLIVIDAHEEALERMKEEMLGHPQAQCYLLESPLQIEPLAKKVAWRGVFLRMGIVGDGEEFVPLRKELEKAHLGVDLILSDASDCGSCFSRNLKAQGVRPIRQGMKLAGVFNNIPAIVVGAGPSLKNNGHLIEKFCNRALILGGGSALNLLAVEPHFSASIDQKAPYQQFKRSPFWESPFCFQRRMNFENFSLIHGEAILFPDSHFSFLNWLDGEQEVFDGGWTVGNFLTALAVLMGCNPIIFVGMDLCYEAFCKYAERLGEVLPVDLVEAVDKHGNKVATQRDWLMARQWIDDLAIRHSNLSFIDASEGGLALHASIVKRRLDELILPEQGDLKELVWQTVQKLPFMEGGQHRRMLWKQSLNQCMTQVQSDLSAFGEESFFEDEIVYEKLLFPLWRIWGPLFERETDLIPDALQHREKQKLNRLLFFQRVIREHLDAI